MFVFGSNRVKSKKGYCTWIEKCCKSVLQLAQLPGQSVTASQSAYTVWIHWTEKSYNMAGEDRRFCDSTQNHAQLKNTNYFQNFPFNVFKSVDQQVGNPWKVKLSMRVKGSGVTAISCGEVVQGRIKILRKVNTKY